jgi:hypothetical protein
MAVQQEHKTRVLALKRTDSQGVNLTADLAEIAAVWPELPEYIKAAIKTLVKTYKGAGE